METGKIVMDKPSKELLEDADIREFYLGLVDESVDAISLRDVKHYRRKKRWSA
jgi:branched-chain amino acid transport system ATP-binding protein